jgi:5'-3' exonuclease
MSNIIKIKKDGNILFIDLSYYIFYRYYALMSWYNKQEYEEINIENLSEDIIFKEKYIRLFISSIKRLQDKFGINNEEVIFAQDCCRCEIWRNNYYEDYKKGREENVEKFNPYCFTLTYREIIPLLEKRGYNSLKIDRAEADDIVGILKMRIRDIYENKKIYIITNDKDYLQLLDNNTEIYNGQGLNIAKKSLGDAYIDLEMKIMRGDSSDNIKSIFTGRRVTNKKLLEILNSDNREIELKNFLEKYFELNPESEDRYNLNRILIDMREIPYDIKNNILNRIEFEM